MTLYMNCYTVMLFTLSNTKLEDRLCCAGIPKSGGVDFSYFLNDPKRYVDEIFSGPFKIHDRYTGRCDDQVSKICNKTIYYDDDHPVSVSIGTLAKCNAKCKHCIAEGCRNNVSVELETEITKKLIKELSKLSFISELQISGTGEATIYDIEDILSVVDPAFDTKRLALLTNGSNPDIIEKLLENHKNLIVRLSLISLNKNKLESYYQLSHYDKLMSFLTTTKYNNRIEINFIGLDDYIEDFDDIHDFCVKHGFVLNVFADRTINTKENIEKIKNLEKLYPDCTYRRYKR